MQQPVAAIIACAGLFLLRNTAGVVEAGGGSYGRVDVIVPGEIAVAEKQGRPHFGFVHAAKPLADTEFGFDRKTFPPEARDRTGCGQADETAVAVIPVERGEITSEKDVLHGCFDKLAPENHNGTLIVTGAGDAVPLPI
ncbi:hypothetical protein D3C87_1365020 [compost metagenome]